MELSKAKEIAARTKEILAPYCERIEIAGSIRRCKPEVKDIEIVCIPSTVPVQNLFGDSEGSTLHSGFIDQVEAWKKVKGTPHGKYTQRELPDGIMLDLFMVTSRNWGFQMAIRTGSADFSHRVLGAAWKRNGFTAENGLLHRDGGVFAVREERDLFDMLGLTYVEPEMRSI